MDGTVASGDVARANNFGGSCVDMDRVGASASGSGSAWHALDTADHLGLSCDLTF